MSVEIASVQIAADATSAREIERTQVNEIVENTALASKGSGADAASDALLNMRKGSSAQHIYAPRVQMELGKNLAFTVADNPELLNVDASMRSFNEHDAVTTTVDDSGNVVRTSVLNDASGRVKSVGYADVVNTPKLREADPAAVGSDSSSDSDRGTLNKQNDAELARIAEMDAIEADHAAASADAKAVEAEQEATKQAELETTAIQVELDAYDDGADVDPKQIDPQRIKGNAAIAPKALPETTPETTNVLGEAKLRSGVLRDIDDSDLQDVLIANGAVDIRDVDIADVESVELLVIDSKVNSARGALVDPLTDVNITDSYVAGGYIANVPEQFVDVSNVRAPRVAPQDFTNMTYVAPIVPKLSWLGRGSTGDRGSTGGHVSDDRPEEMLLSGASPTDIAAVRTRETDEADETDAIVISSLLNRLDAIRARRAEVLR